jgi:hypothetical protein
MAEDGELRAADWWQHDHGDCCDCMALARATGAGPETVDFNYCRTVLQKRWRLKCNHGRRSPGERTTPQIPMLDAGDPVQAILIVNADLSSG